MASNEQLRRASGAAMEQSRRASGAAMEQSRRAGGQAMIERRTGQSEADDIRSLIELPRQRGALRSLDPRDGIPSRRGSGAYDPIRAGHSAAGIAGPLVETAATTREYWPQGLRSSDGLFVLPAIKTLNLVDANGAAVQIQLANPAGTA